ncbi:unnamed protein product, partial [Symbiodinium necroappetens]
MLNKADGTQCEDEADVSRRWREHFGSLEGGRDSSFQALVDETQEMGHPDRSSHWPHPADTAGVPSLATLQQVLAATKTGKAPGLDSIPAELCRHFAVDLARVLYPVLMKQMWRGCEAVGVTSFVLFADIASAFYCTVTQLVANTEGDIDSNLLQRITAELHIAPEDVATLQHRLSQPSAMKLAGADPWLEAITGALSTSNWFVMRGDTTPIATARGSRPGSSFADIVFALLLPKVLQARDTLRATSAPAAEAPRVPWDGVRSLKPCESGAADITVEEIVWADDIAVPRWTIRNNATRAAIAVEAGSLADACAEHGLRLSYGAAKTAALASICGPGSRAIRKALFGGTGLKGTMAVVREHAAPATLPLVGHYKHLGAVQAPGGSIRLELRHRIASAKAAYHEARRKIFKNRGIQIRRKAIVLEATVLSRLTLGAGSWPSLCKADQAAFDAAVWHFYRGIICSSIYDSLLQRGPGHLMGKLASTHVTQAPPEPVEGQWTDEPAGVADVQHCPTLLANLEELYDEPEERVWETIADHIEPLDTLRHTVRTWRDRHQQCAWHQE